MVVSLFAIHFPDYLFLHSSFSVLPPANISYLSQELMFRKFITILILSCLLIYMGGYHLIYGVYRAGIKQDMRAYLKNHADTKMGEYLSFRVNNHIIQTKEFDWEETDQEFSYRGGMYDVVNIRYTADSVFICALPDSRENNLADQLATLHNNAQDHHTSTLSLIKMFSVFTQIIPENIVSYPLFRTEHNGYPGITLFRISADVQSPPPRIFA
jgi:hypothetical protein